MTHRTNIIFLLTYNQKKKFDHLSMVLPECHIFNVGHTKRILKIWSMLFYGQFLKAMIFYVENVQIRATVMIELKFIHTILFQSQRFIGFWVSFIHSNAVFFSNSFICIFHLIHSFVFYLYLWFSLTLNCQWPKKINKQKRYQSTPTKSIFNAHRHTIAYIENPSTLFVRGRKPSK